MHKRIALKLSVFCCALLIATAVVAAPRHQTAGSRSGSDGATIEKTSSGSTLSLQRLLSKRLQLSLELFMQLRSQEAPEETKPGIGKLTIVDEPDPFAFGKDDPAEPGEDPDETQDRRRQEQDGANPNTQPYQSMN
jgi:hypothetical protein